MKYSLKFLWNSFGGAKCVTNNIMCVSIRTCYLFITIPQLHLYQLRILKLTKLEIPDRQ